MAQTKAQLVDISTTGVAAGSASTPGITFTGDLNTGIYSPGADQVAISTNGSGRLFVNSSGSVGIGTSSPGSLLHIEGSGTSALAKVVNSSSFSGGTNFTAPHFSIISGNDTTGNVTRLALGVGSGGQTFIDSILEDGATAFASAVIRTRGADGVAERLRITSSGSVGIGSTSAVWDERLSVTRTTNNVVAGFYTTSSSYTASVVRAQAETAPGTGWQLYQGRDDGGTINFNVYGNGNVQNTNNSYGQLSDVKLKENIVDAASQWADLKAVQVRNFNFKEGQTHRQIGVIAQEIEQVSPGLVYESPDRDEEGNNLGTVTKSVNYSVLYMKAVKALQEAMERIEQLEAKVAALEAA